MAIVQTADGYLWLATEDGLVRFDGVRFTVFNKKNTKEIRHNHIQELFAGKDGSLWIGTKAGLSRLKDGKFINYTARIGLPENNIMSICEDQEGNIWLGTFSAGLIKLRNEKFKIYTSKDGLPSGSVISIYEDNKGVLWLGTTNGLIRFYKSKFKPYTKEDGLSDNYVSSIAGDKSGNLWIGTIDGCLNRSNFESEEKIKVYCPKDGLSKGELMSLHMDRQDNLWIGKYGGGLNRFKDGRISKYLGLSDNDILAIYEDREGSLWIGTENGGLNRLKDGIFTTYSTAEGLSNNIVLSICQDQQENVWIGTEGGLNRLKNGKITHYTKKEGLYDNTVSSIYPDSKGRLWIVTNALNKFENGKFTAYTKEDGVFKDIILSTYEDRQGNLWIGEYGALHRMNQGRYTTYTTKDGLSDGYIYCMYEDRKGYLWIGTAEGLNRFRDGKFTVYTRKDGLSNDEVLCLYGDNDGSLWIGTNGGGLNRLSNGKFTAFTAENGLLDDVMYQILEDDKGNLWMGCNKGVFHVSKKELTEFAQGKVKSIKSTSYNETDGMKSRECLMSTQPAGWKTRDGKLWFATLKGAAVIDPDDIKVNHKTPPLVIEEVIVDNQLAELRNEARFSPGKKRFEFKYTALTFLAPDKIKFKYKLEGFDTDWVDAGGRRLAYYNQIPPGRYTFRVIACNNDGIWSHSGASYNFYLEPYFHQTGWFYVLCALLLTIIGWTLHRYRLSRALEMERLRTRIATDLHDDIGSGLSQIAILSEVARKHVTEENSLTAEPLIKIAGLSRELMDSMSDIVWAVNPSKDRLADLILRLRRFVGDMMTARDIKFQFHSSGLEQDQRVGPDLRREIFLIFKESINNMVRHSQCTEAEITFAMERNDLVLKVSDNGRGFDTVVITDGQGLDSMKLRAERLGGRLTVISKRNHGTTLTLRVPLVG